jgi:Protein of unknown function (DUF2911)
MRKPIIVGSALMVTLTLAGIALVAQQDKSSRPSPPAKAECQLPNGKSVTVDYSSPRAKGRKIFGSLVPYGKVWRAGANEATTLVTASDISVGGKTVPPGDYTIFAIPAEDKWTLIVSKKTGEWGTAYPGPENDLARIDMKASKTSAPVENFTIAFDQSGNGCAMRMEWENTRASVEITPK